MRRAAACTVVAALLVGACTSSSEEPRDDPAVVVASATPVDASVLAAQLQPGTSTRVALGDPWTAVESVEASSQGGVSLDTYGGALVVSAETSVKVGSYAISVSGSACQSSDCGKPFSAELAVQVLPLEAATGVPVASFPLPSPGRISSSGFALPGAMVELNDEAILMVGSPSKPGNRATAAEIAEAAGAVVTGGMEELGVYQIRWDGPQDMDRRVSELGALPMVGGVDRALLVTAPELSTEPDDWDDDGLDGTWHLRQAGAPEAWEMMYGSEASSSGQTNTPVGIVDTADVARHPDLRIDARTSPEPDGAGGHATHVAGLACATQDGEGVVGMAWGCPLISDHVSSVQVKYSGASEADIDAEVYRMVLLSSAIPAIARVIKAGAKVVNLSLGWNMDPVEGNQCASAEQAQAVERILAEYGDTMGASFIWLAGGLGEDVVFTVAAGNECSEGVWSPFRSASDHDNVITVAASNSDDTLASFSNSGAEVVAGGGGAVPPLVQSSTLVSSDRFGVWSTWTDEQYRDLYGTSMAAPLVAGAAALVRDANPSLSAAQVGRCLVGPPDGETVWVDRRSQYPIWNSIEKNIRWKPESDSVARMPELDVAAALACADPRLAINPEMLRAADLLNAPVPSVCGHPAGQLVEGELRGIPPVDGYVALHRDETGDPEAVATELVDAEPAELLAKVNCSQGGVGWPPHLVLYGTGPTVLGHLDMAYLGTAAEHATVLSIEPVGNAVRVTWDTYEGAGYDFRWWTGLLRFDGTALVMDRVAETSEPRTGSVGIG